MLLTNPTSNHSFHYYVLVFHSLHLVLLRAVLPLELPLPILIIDSYKLKALVSVVVRLVLILLLAEHSAMRPIHPFPRNKHRQMKL